MDGHRPIFTLINYDQKIENYVFSVLFSKQMLIMNSQEEEGLLYHYTRINEFPE